MIYGYCRCSTGRQQASGLGLEAQRAAIERYAEQKGEEIGSFFVEAESGALRDRPQLNAALAICRRQKATLVIAKLDRLSRNVAFIANLMDGGVEFVACDMPYASKLTLHLLAAFAQFEREQIAERTKAALAAAKARGVKLGTYGTVLASQNRADAHRFAERVRPHIEAARSLGLTSTPMIARYLSENNIPTATGGAWYPATVNRLLGRLI